MKRVIKPKMGMKVYGKIDTNKNLRGKIIKISPNRIGVAGKLITRREEIIIDTFMVSDWACHQKGNGTFGANCREGTLYEASFKEQVLDDSPL